MKHDDTSYTKNWLSELTKIMNQKLCISTMKPVVFFKTLFFLIQKKGINQLIFTCSKSTTEALEKGVKYVQS